MSDLESTWDKKVNSKGNSKDNLFQSNIGTFLKLRCKLELQRKERESIA